MKIIKESIDTTGEFAKSPAFSDYRMLLAELEKTYKSAGSFSDEFFSNFELIIRYGPFRKLGKGSSRTAYSFDADPRYALKFAHNENGVRQNQTEVKNAKKGDYTCLVRILDYDNTGVLIVEDNCRQSEYDDWNRILGVSPNMLSKLVRTVIDRRKNPRSRDYSLRDLYDDIEDIRVADVVLRKTSPLDDEFLPKDHPRILNCVKNMLKAYDGERTAAKWKALSDLVRFYCDNGDGAMIPEEILYVDQWGVKSGTTPDDDSLIIVDPGVDDDFRPFVGQDGERVR